MTLLHLLVWLGSYLFGCILWGPIVVKLTKGCAYEVDIFYLFHHGSKNPGATNVGRMTGTKEKIATIFLDAAKGTLAVWLASYVGLPLWAVTISGFMVIMGHAFPIYYILKGYHGGKAVATTLGVFLFLAPKITFFALILYIAIGLVGKKFKLVAWAKFARMSSVRSLTACYFLMLLSIFADGRIEIAKLAGASAILITWLHRENMNRISQGTEPAG